MDLKKGDCLEVLKTLPDKSIDFVYLDLPYGQTACKWDKKLDLSALWKELKRLARSERTPFFFSCTTKFGYEIIKSNEKYFRWDLVWEKNRAAGFLNAYKLPMRKHEMIYCFAKKSPEYDVTSHNEYTEEKLPIRIQNDIYGKVPNVNRKRHKDPLPTSILPPQEDHELVYCFAKKSPEYDVSSHSEYTEQKEYKHLCNSYGKDETNKCKAKTHKNRLPTTILPPQEDPPSSWCKFKLDSNTGHRTAKPVALMEFLLKYWTQEGWTVLDPTMGSGSMGIACKRMKRKFIGIEKDDDIFELAKQRINTSS